jgi:hypothetical protein
MKIVYTLIISVIFHLVGLAQHTNYLFIGNSYTHYNKMSKTFENIANSKGKNVQVDTLAVSNSTLKFHATRKYTYKKLRSKYWDNIIIQGFSRELAQDTTTIAEETLPYVSQLIDSIKKINPCTKIYFFMTWPYQNGFTKNDVDYSRNQMLNRINNGYRFLQNKLTIPIIPIGIAWNQVYQEHPEINLYQEDLQHPNELGSFLVACGFYAAFFQEIPTEVPLPKGLKNTHVQKYITTVSAMVIANYYSYIHSYKVIPSSKEPPVLNFDLTEKWTMVQVTNKTKNLTNVYWDFGDGHISDGTNPKHFYKNNGTYTVTMHATSACKSYELRKKITVSKKVKYANATKK